MGQELDSFLQTKSLVNKSVNSQFTESSISSSDHRLQPAITSPPTGLAPTGFYLNDEVIKEAIERVRNVRKNLAIASKIKH